MELYYTTTSPFARKVRILLLESGIESQVRLVSTTVRDPDSEILSVSPPGKVPVLRIKNGIVLSEANYICAFLNANFDEVQMLPSGDEGLDLLALEGLACGFLEGVVIWVRALRAPEHLRNPKAIALEEGRVMRCLETFELKAEIWTSEEPPFLLPHITLVCALGALSFRLPEFDWQKNHPTLAAWWIKISLRNSVIETAPFE